MMTVGNTARTQFNMAQVQTKYGNSLNSLYGAALAKRYGSTTTKAASQSLEDLLKSNRLKNKDENFREQFSNLYKSIYGITDDESSADDSYSSKQSIKAASSSAGSAAESMKTFADQLKYGGELDLDTYKAKAQSFVDSYNSMVEKVGNSDSQQILQKGVLMVNTGKVYSNSLKRAGITVGSDNKLSLNSDLSKVKASDVKFIMGSNGFSDKVIQKAGQINSLAGGSGIFSSGSSSSVGKPGSSTDTSDKVDNADTLKELTAYVKDTASSLQSYIDSLGSEGKTFAAEDYSDTANKFIEKYNTFIDEMNNSDKASVRSRGQTMQSIARSYKYSLGRAGIEVGKDGKLTMAKNINDITEKDVKYAFGGTGGFLDKAAQKADQVKGLVTGASAMGYNADKTTAYAYNSGALYSTYA